MEAWLYREVTQGRSQYQDFSRNSRTSPCTDVNSFLSLSMALLTSLSVIQRRSISLMEGTHSIRVLRTPHPVTPASWNPVQLPSDSFSSMASTVPFLFRAFSQGLTHSRHRINASLPMMKTLQISSRSSFGEPDQHI